MDVPRLSTSLTWVCTTWIALSGPAGISTTCDASLVSKFVTILDNWSNGLTMSRTSTSDLRFDPSGLVCLAVVLWMALLTMVSMVTCSRAKISTWEPSSGRCPLRWMNVVGLHGGAGGISVDEERDLVGI